MIPTVTSTLRIKVDIKVAGARTSVRKCAELARIWKLRTRVTSARPVITPPPGRRRRPVFFTNRHKLAAVEEFDDLLLATEWPEAIQSFQLVYPQISVPRMLRWQRRVVDLRADNQLQKFAKQFVTGRCVAIRTEAWFPAAEARVLSQFRDAREEGLPCNGLWFQVKMQEALQEMYPDGSADDFVAGDGWRANFFNRNNLAMRSATNVMPLSVAERVPKCLHFYAVIQKVCAERGGMNHTWGRFPPQHRFNADEVPVEFSGP